MKSVNKVILLGTLGRDPEVRYVAANTVPVVRFSLATNERFKDDQGNWQDRTEWHTVVAWRRLAEIIGQYVHKGDRLYVEGKLQTSSWEDQRTGEKKYRTEIVADDLVLIGGRREATGEAASARSAAAPAGESFDQRTPEQAEPAPGSAPITDSDIPF
jgi:single-strand DNA-binding protein